MRSDRRRFLDGLLGTASPSGFELRAQRVWTDYLADVAEEIRTDAYGNAVASAGGDGPAIAFAGHADEIGYIVRSIDDDGFLHLGAIGGADRTVSKGRHVEVHATDGPVDGVIGQTAIHLREEDEGVEGIDRQYVDVGAADGEEARDLVDVSDPVTVATGVTELCGGRLAARGMDNRVGIWAAAEGLRRAVEAGVDATVHAVSTVQEEIGHGGARMVGFDLDPDAVVALDVTHAVDTPGAPSHREGEVALGDGPVITRGSANHPVLVDAMRAAAAGEDIDVQLQAAGSGTRTDADGFYTQRGGIPTLVVSVPNRYMHTPVEVVDATDLRAVADLLAAFAAHVEDAEAFAVDV